MPDHSFHHHSQSSAAVATAWERLQDPALWAMITGIDSTSSHRHNAGPLEGFDFSTVIGGVTYRGKARVTDFSPERAMTLRIDSTEIAGRVAIHLEPNNTGTRVSVELSIRPAGLVGTLAFPVVRQAVAREFPASVERLAAALAES